MAMTHSIPPANLQDEIHTALKSWHEADVSTSALVRLQLCQAALAGKTGSVRQAVNQMLLQALQQLAGEQALKANLLRKRFLDGLMMYEVANQLNLGESTAYRRQQEALTQLTHIVWQMELRARNQHRTMLEEQLDLPLNTQLFGIEAHLEALQDVVKRSGPPWLISIEGLGGIGKTALANTLIRQPNVAARYQHIGWVSAKQQTFLPGQEMEATSGPALTIQMLVEVLLEQLDEAGSPGESPQQQRATLTRLLKQAPHLIVIDNLETVEDYEALLPLLRELANPTKFLLTSRHSLQAHSDVFCRRLDEISQADAFEFIRYEAGLRGLSVLTEASTAQLQRIYEVVGGNPLALKLVIGQLSVLPLSQVLDGLKQASGQKVGELYTYIYWRAWHLLDSPSRQTLLVMPLAQGGTLAQLLSLTGLEPDALAQALALLASLSLLEVSGGLDERRYRIHRLTETFLLEDALKWQP